MIVPGLHWISDVGWFHIINAEVSTEGLLTKCSENSMGSHRLVKGRVEVEADVDYLSTRSDFGRLFSDQIGCIVRLCV